MPWTSHESQTAFKTTDDVLSAGGQGFLQFRPVVAPAGL